MTDAAEVKTESALLELAERCEAYNPKLSPDNYGDELELHRDIVMVTGEGSMNPAFEQTFVRSLDAALTLVPEGWPLNLEVRNGRIWAFVGTPCRAATASTPALALCAASLRARASLPPSTETRGEK